MPTARSVRGDAQAGRRVALGIEVDQQDLLIIGGERGRQVDRGRGFADAPLLVRDRENAHTQCRRRFVEDNLIRLWEGHGGGH